MPRQIFPTGEPIYKADNPYSRLSIDVKEQRTRFKTVTSTSLFFNMIFLYIFLISNIYGASTTVQEPSFLKVDKSASSNNLDQIGNREGRCKYDSFYFICILITIKIIPSYENDPGFICIFLF